MLLFQGRFAQLHLASKVCGGCDNVEILLAVGQKNRGRRQRVDGRPTAAEV